MNTNDSKCLKRSYRAVSIFFFSKCMRSVSVSIISANVWDFHIRIVCLWYQLGQNQKQSLLETHWHPTCEFRGLALKLWPLSCWVMRFRIFPSPSHLILACACASHFNIRMRISFWPAHAHPILAYACASHFDLRMRISFWPARAHLISTCACASHFGLRKHIQFWPARAHLILACASASHFDLRVRISFWPARAHLILTCACASYFGLRMRISF